MTVNRTPLPPRWNPWRTRAVHWRRVLHALPRPRWWWAVGVTGGWLLLVSCTTAPPRNVDDACAIFAEYGGWLELARCEPRLAASFH